MTVHFYIQGKLTYEHGIQQINRNSYYSRQLNNRYDRSSDHPATGKTLAGEPAYAVDLVDLCKALGVQHVEVVDAFDVDRLQRL